MPPEKKNWSMLTVRLARDAEELSVSLFFDLGANGTVILDETERDVEIGAYFPSDVRPDAIVTSLRQALGRANLLASLKDVEFKLVKNEDWLLKWKEGFEAVEAGETLLIAPSWKIDDLLADSSTSSPGILKGPRKFDLPRSVRGRILIQIDPGMAFGTGTHETTRLCLEAIERHWKGGKFLDVGTGTGILAMAAAVLVPGSEIVAIDVDPVAIGIARQNLAANNLDWVRVSEGQPNAQSSGDFDVVVANLTATVIVDTLESLTAAVKPSGCLIVSGILSEQAADVALALDDKGFITTERRGAGEWVCLVARSE